MRRQAPRRHGAGMVRARQAPGTQVKAGAMRRFAPAVLRTRLDLDGRSDALIQPSLCQASRLSPEIDACVAFDDAHGKNDTPMVRLRE